MSNINSNSPSPGAMYLNRLRSEALEVSASHSLPSTSTEWQTFSLGLRETLFQTLKLAGNRLSAPVFTIHRESHHGSFRIQSITFEGSHDIPVPGNLYIPAKPGRFPGILLCHGHSTEGRLHAQVQLVAQALVQSDFVVLSTDAPGSGERGESDVDFAYHGALRGALPWLVGDSLLGWQVRENQRALDLLQSLSCVDPGLLGVTGASGGGNQTTWISALDDRVKAAVPVVSVGTLESYVGRRNCVCETLPGGLKIAEEWALLGLIAPRALLILNSIHDVPAFSVPPFSKATSAAQHIFQFHDRRHAFDARLFDQPHGYGRPMIEAMLGWMTYWLRGLGSASPQMMPHCAPLASETLRCFAAGKRPPSYSYRTARESILRQSSVSNTFRKQSTKESLAKMLNWTTPGTAFISWLPGEAFGVRYGTLTSPRSLPLPIELNASSGAARDLTIILSPGGAIENLGQRQNKAPSTPEGATVTIDLPGTGQLAWENDALAKCDLHDTSRACVWLGYSLCLEWAECIALLLSALRSEYPHSSLHLESYGPCVPATLIALLFSPESNATHAEYDCPRSLDELSAWEQGSLAWIIPGILSWGDLDDLRRLVSENSQVSREH